MNNDKSAIGILADTLAIMTERAMTAERELATKIEDSNHWYERYTEQKKQTDELSAKLRGELEEHTATKHALSESLQHAGQMEAERNTAQAELENQKGGVCNE